MTEKLNFFVHVDLFIHIRYIKGMIFCSIFIEHYPLHLEMVNDAFMYLYGNMIDQVHNFLIRVVKLMEPNLLSVRLQSLLLNLFDPLMPYWTIPYNIFFSSST